MAAHRASASVEIDQFLNPKSMLTPGLAGAMTMMIANTLWVQFGLPQNWTGLLVSAVFALLVSSRNKFPILQFLGYSVLNSLIIFSVAMGSNQAGIALSIR